MIRKVPNEIFRFFVYHSLSNFGWFSDTIANLNRLIRIWINSRFPSTFRCNPLYISTSVFLLFLPLSFTPHLLHSETKFSRRSKRRLLSEGPKTAFLMSKRSSENEYAGFFFSWPIILVGTNKSKPHYIFLEVTIRDWPNTWMENQNILTVSFVYKIIFSVQPAPRSFCNSTRLDSHFSKLDS